MEPSIASGSDLLVRPLKSYPQVGLIYAYLDQDEYTSEAKLVAHRLIELREGGMAIFKGDARRRFDDPISITRIVGLIEALDRQE